MLPKYFTLILTFYLISPESRNLLAFCCAASIVYNIMLLTLILNQVLAVLFSKETQWA